MPKLPFIDYSVQNPLSSGVILNNDQATPLATLSYPWSGSEAVVIEYSIIRGGSIEVGRILIATDGSTVSFSIDSANQVYTGVTLSAVINGLNIILQYVSNNTGQNGVFKFVKRTLTS